MRERERKERGEILSEDGREIRWMKEIWKSKGVEDRNKNFMFYFLELLFFFIL
jgi:hypothetical protein